MIDAIPFEKKEGAPDIPKASIMAKKIEDSKRYRQSYTKVWDLCSLFLQGKQHLRWNKNLKNYITAPEDRRKNRVTVNIILNIYRNILARLSIAYPSIAVMPSSPSTDDIEKAEASETMLRYYWHNEHMKDTITEVLEWLLLTGNSAFHTFYDPDDDRVRTRAVSPYDLLFEEGTTTPSEAKWVSLRHIVTKEDLKAAYPDQADYIEKSGSAPDNTYDSLYQRAAGNNGAELKDRLEIFEVYTSNGEMGMLLGTKWLYKCCWPTKQSPLTFVRYTNVPGRLWGLGMVEPLLELQMMYNKARTQVMHNAELMGNPKWLVPKSSGVSRDALSDSRPGEKVMYNATSGPPPQQIAAAPLPNYILDNIKQLSAEMLDVAGVHSTTLGKRAIGIESGAAIQSLANKDSQQLQVTQSNIEQAIREVSVAILEMCKKFYDKPKMIRMMDETGRIVHKALQNTDLVDSPEVYLEAGTLFRDEKPDRDQRILEMTKLGLLDKTEALKALDYKTGNARVTKRMAGFSHAHDMLNAVLVGAAIEVFPTDDLEAFSEVFGSFMRREEYYQMPPERQDYIRDVYVSIASFGKPDEEFQEMEFTRTVFPRVEKQPDEAVAGMASMTSGLGASQMGQASMDMQQRRSLLDEGNPEAGLSNVRMGGTG